jgi:hypothetical protein
MPAHRSPPPVFRATPFFLLAAACSLSCGGSPSGSLPPPGALQPIGSAMLEAGHSVRLSLVKTGVPVVALSFGALPAGLQLDPAGAIVGSPTQQGQLAWFTLTESDIRGDVLDERSYALGVGVDATNLAAPPDPTRQSDALLFDGMTWNQPLTSAYAWDPDLAMLWPLRADASLHGAALAPTGASLSLIVSGADATGNFPLTMAPCDARIATVAQLTWFANAGIELQVLPGPELNAAPVTAMNTSMQVNGAWEVQHEIDEQVSPGPEVAAFASDVPAGRYALVAVKDAGTDVAVPLWLTIHQRNGTEILQQRFDGLLSDIAKGPVADEMAAHRQSYVPLGVLVVSAQGAITYDAPADGADPFRVAAAL